MLNRRDRAKARDNVVELRPRQLVSCKANIPLIVLAYGLFLVTLGINAWVAYTKGTTIPDKILMASLGAIFEAMWFYLPSHSYTLWRQDQYLRSLLAGIFCIPLCVFVVYTSLGFASLFMDKASTVRAERITPAVADAQRRLDTLATSRNNECLKRGDRCRQLEKEEQTAIESLREARQTVSVLSDPQIASAAKLVSWISVGRYNPTADDFAMLRLLLLTLLPQLGGLVLMVAKRA
jgi:hypothetical protein